MKLYHKDCTSLFNNIKPAINPQTDLVKDLLVL